MIDDKQPEDLVLRVLLDDGQLTQCSSWRQAQNLAKPEKFEQTIPNVFIADIMLCY